MGLPTLLKKGNLIPAMGESKDFLDTFTGIEYILNWFDTKIGKEPKDNSDRFVVVESQTGSGKSTVMPTELYLKFQDKIKNIIVTQPRVATTVDIPKTIVNVPVYKSKLKLGKNIGFQTGDFQKKPIEKGILFSTVGILLQFLKIMEPLEFCNKYSFVILDEAHDRSTQLDLVFFYLKKLLDVVKLKDMPFVILTSGTMNIELYKKYFNTNTAFSVVGDSYPIQDNWLEYDTDNILISSVDRLKKIHNEEGDRHKSDIVLFSPTNGIITKLKKLVNELNEKDEYFKKSILLPIGLDSSVFKSVGKEYSYVFDDIDTIPVENLKRKLIMGTNSIETGITLETISYCVDTGLVNSLEYNPVLGIDILIVRPVTQAMSKQRRGRVGRIQEGTFYALYSKDTYDSLQDIQYPEMITSNMVIPILNICCSNVSKDKNGIDIFKKKIDTMEKIPNITISKCLYYLYSYGLINNKLYPTDLGKIVNKIRMLSIENILLILKKETDVNTLDMITLASYLTIGKQGITTKKFKLFSSEYLTRDIKKYLKCEWLEFLLIFQEFKKIIKDCKGDVQQATEFCDKIGLSLDSMVNFIEFRYDIILDIHATTGINFGDVNDDFENLFSISVKIKKAKEDNNTELLKLFVSEFKEKVSNIKKILYSSYKLNMAVCIGTNTFKCLSNGLIVKYYTFIAEEGQTILYDNIIVRKNITGAYEPSFVNGITNITNCNVPIEPIIQSNMF